MTFLGQPIEVGMHLFILAQVFGLAVLAFDFWSFQTTDQFTYFKRSTLSSFFWLLMYLFIGAQAPVLLVSGFSTLRNGIFTWAFSVDSPKRRMIARRTLYSSLVIAGVSAFIAIPAARQETQIFQVFLLIGVLAFVVGQYMPGVYPLRITAAFYAVTVLLVNTPLDTFNPVGIIIEANKILAIVVFFAIYFRKQKERNRLAGLQPAALSLGMAA
ncbi:MAG: hypothetical protein LBB54_00285 [Cellulomonadaceae bacterium]|jgi:hypothetical protein|nr:hypothetical protein [Cellulomonadaceae bacterium]